MALLSRNVSLSVALGGCLGASLAFVGSCIGPDPNHCHHNNGDAFCGGSTPYCNYCLPSSENKGCVAEMPEEKCYSPGDDPFVDTGSTSTGDMTTTDDDATDDGMTTGTTGPSDCTAEGERDELCPDDAPFCLEGVCAPCQDMGGDDYCAGLDGSLPVCGALGDCVQCSDANTSVCVGDTQFCDPLGSCSGCYEHSQCGDYGCNLFTGQCMDDGVINWVEGPECATETGFGTMDEPYCNLGSAQQNVDEGDSIMTIRIMSPDSFAQAVTASSGEVVAVIGDNGIPEIGDATALQAVNTGIVLVQNLRLDGANETNVRCNSNGKVWIRDTKVTSNNSGNGMQLDPGCSAVIERSIISLNSEGGISVDRADVEIYSSAVMSNGEDDQATYGINLSGGTFTASHLTVITNKGNTGGRNINCVVSPATGGQTEVSIRNSIIMHPQDVSFAGCDELDDFEIVYSAVDDDAYSGDGVMNIAYQGSYFASPSFEDPHLLAGTPFNNVAQWRDGDPRVDLDREPFSTTPGAGNFAGCDERQ